MASLLPRSAFLPRRIQTSATTSSCTSPVLTRLFSSTPSAQAQSIPPESPFFINVPNPPQDQSIEERRELKRVRGYLPIPRAIFHRRDGHQKITREWLKKSAPKLSKANAAIEPANELQAWRRKMADSRRENMRYGIKSLWERKERVESRRLALRTARFIANKEASMAPEREDDILTRGSINPAVLQTAVILDPHRFVRAVASAERTAGKIALKSERRRDALQTLYMNARSFIVNEADLNAAIQDRFADDYFDRKGQSATGYAIHNIWDAENEPMTLEGMVKDHQQSSSLLVNDMTPAATRTIRRQKHVAEELTGGKMD